MKVSFEKNEGPYDQIVSLLIFLLKSKFLISIVEQQSILNCPRIERLEDFHYVSAFNENRSISVVAYNLLVGNFINLVSRIILSKYLQWNVPGQDY